MSEAESILATSHTAILAVGFIAPAFAVVGALAMGIPVAIHLLNRRRFKVVDWAAMSFLLAAMKRNRRRLKFESWLLLAVRCLVVGLLGLALARPMGCDRSTLAAFAGQRSGVHVIVIDNSYSMAYVADRPDAKTHLDQAKKLAKQLIARLAPGGESVAIVSAGKPATAVIASPTYDLATASSAIDRIEQSFGGTDLPGALNQSVEIADAAPPGAEKFLDILTDGTRSACESPQGAGLDTTGAAAAKRFHVSLFDLAKPGQWNASAVDLRSGGGLVKIGFPNDFVATLRAFGRDEDTPLQWRFDGQPLHGAPTAHPSADPLDVTLADVPVRDGGPHVISAALSADDKLPADDTRYRVIEVAAAMKTLIVEGEHGASAMEGSAFFLNVALAPPSGVEAKEKSPSYVAPETISDIELGNRVFSDYRAIILAGVARISAADADRLRAFVQQGGALLIFMGDAINGEGYNDVLLPRGLIPGTLTRRISAAGDAKPFHFDFKPDGLVDPLLRIFARQPNTGLDTADVYTYWQVALAPDAKARRVLNYAGGGDATTRPDADPAITIQPLGDGRIVFVSTSANAEWTSLPAKPAYVPLMHELLSGAVGAGERWMNHTIGETLDLPPGLKLTNAPALKDPSQVDVPIESATSADGSVVYRSRPLMKPGVYQLSTGDRRIPIAVNLSADEADVRPLDAGALRQAFGNIPIEIHGDTLPEIAAASQSGNDFGWSVLLAVMTLAALECALAMWFGHDRRPARVDA